MGVGNLRGLLLPIAKEALEKSMIVAKFFCVLHITSTYICYPALTEGPSMLPTLSLTGDLLLVDKISPRLGKVGSGDIVLVRSPENPRKIVAKRVKGMEGDTITYLADPDKINQSQTLVVPKGHLWIEGDNLYASKDSRMFGAVPYGLIHGKVIWKPFEKLRLDDFVNVSPFFFNKLVSYGRRGGLDQLTDDEDKQTIFHK